MTAQGRRGRYRLSPRRSSFRPVLEGLEQRLTPALVKPQQAVATTAMVANQAAGDFFAGFKDAKLRDLIQQDMADDGQLSRKDWIAADGIFALVRADGRVSSAEFRDLHRVIKHTDVLDAADIGEPSFPIKMYRYVHNLAGKVIDGDAGNAVYQLKPLGNLAPGSSAGQLNKLVKKWFLGLDRPWTHNRYPYKEAATNPLFGPDGPQVDDINQGDTGDCYFLSSAGTILTRQLTPGSGVAEYFGLYDPATGVNPEGIYIDNHDNTWTVRFYYKEPKTGEWVPDYVTVDRWFSTRTGSSGDIEWNEANGYLPFSHTSIPLWVALVEKAYAQQNASARWAPTVEPDHHVNAYWAISGMYTGNHALMQLTGQDGYIATTDLAGMTFEDIVTAFENGVGVVFGTKEHPPADPTSDEPVVGSHDYMMIGYDASKQTIHLRNPWGWSKTHGTYDTLHPPAHPDHTYLIIEADVAFLQRNFDAFYHINPELIPASK